jgi:hypothetical protein
MPTVIELNTSRQVSYNSGSPIGTRVFTVTGAATEADVYGLFKLDGEPPTNLPNKFSAYPNLSALTPPVRLVALDFNLQKDPDVLDKWDVTVTYREVAIGGGGIGGNPLTQLAPNDEGYLTVRGSTEGGFVEAWRSYQTDDEFNFYYNSKTSEGVPIYAASSEDGDIGGTKIDVAGRPVSLETVREQITVDLTLSYIPDLEKIRQYNGSRNRTSFLGIPRGAVVFKGATWSNIAPGKWSVSYEFAADNFYHLIQQPVLDLNTGKPIPAPNGQAKFVSWVQPFPRILDHRELNGYLVGIP